MELAKKSTILPEQKTAADPLNSVWVSASAGTGKTKVLTDRVLRLLLQGTKPSKILCITYTNAAAAEMATRIHARLQEWAIMPDDKLSESLFHLTSSTPSRSVLIFARSLFTSVIDNEDSLHIYTIHSFCQYLLKRFPLEAGVAPNFRIIDDQESEEMVNESYRLLLNEASTNTRLNNSLGQLAQNINDTSLRKIIKNIIEERIKIRELLNEGTEAISEKIYSICELEANLTNERILADAHKETNLSEIKALITAMHNGSDSDISRAAVLEKWVDNGHINFSDYYSIFITQESKPKKINNIITKEGRKHLLDAEKIVVKEQERLLEIMEKMRSLKIANTSKSVLVIAEALIEFYSRTKESSFALDYNDLIDLSRNLLSRKEISPWVMYKLDGGIEYLLIDEAQDTSPDQWEIIRSISDEFFTGQGSNPVERRIFVVGDDKQSIFSFQGADPAAFEKMHLYFYQKAQESSHPWHTIALNNSFRSTDAVLRLVDEVFSDRTLAHSISALQPAINHKTNRLEEPGRVEIWDLVEGIGDKREKSSDWLLPTQISDYKNAKEVLADKISNQIAEWIKKEHATPGDIMVLVRKRDELVQYLVKKCKQKNIRVSGVDRLKLSDHISIMDLIALGNFVLLPGDDLNLATVLKTPLIGISEDELYLLASTRGRKSVWESLQSHSERNDVYRNAYTYLNLLREKASSLSIFEFYNYVLEVTGGKKKILSRLGDEANDPINEFMTLCLDYETNHTSSLQGFIDWFINGDREIKRNLEQNKDAVRIMTVHASKGLQAPIVILADNALLPPSHPKLLWHESGAFLWPANKKNNNNVCRSLLEELQGKDYDEYLRQLYVAMTRAQDELYICAATDKTPQNDSWFKIIERAMSRIARKKDNGWEITSGNHEKPRMRKAPQEKTSSPLPSFVHRHAEKEMIEKTIENGTKRRSIDEIKAIKRGNAIHKLLEILPDVRKDKRTQVGQLLLQNTFPDIANQENIVTSVLELMDSTSLAHIFTKDSLAEAEIIGEYDGKVESRRIDRLLITDNEVFIIDYKSDAKPPPSREKIPSAYLKQMQSYQKILQKIYPEKRVIPLIIWTENLSLMEI